MVRAGWTVPAGEHEGDVLPGRVRERVAVSTGELQRESAKWESVERGPVQHRTHRAGGVHLPQVQSGHGHHHARGGHHPRPARHRPGVSPGRAHRRPDRRTSPVPTSLHRQTHLRRNPPGHPRRHSHPPVSRRQVRPSSRPYSPAR